MRALFILCVLAATVLSSCDTAFGDDSTLTTPKRAELKEIVYKVISQATEHRMSRENQQFQFMGLTLTLLVGMIGFTFSKDGIEHKWILLLLAFAFTLFMRAIDTFQEDLNQRQAEYSTILNAELLNWDSLDSDRVRKVLDRITSGNLPNDSEDTPGWRRKLTLYLCPPTFKAIWWNGLAVGVAIPMGIEYIRARRPKKRDKQKGS